MTPKEAKQLVPEEDYVLFAGATYKVADVADVFGACMVGIYDEPPSEHVDYIGAYAVEPDPAFQ